MESKSKTTINLSVLVKVIIAILATFGIVSACTNDSQEESKEETPKVETVDKKEETTVKEESEEASTEEKEESVDAPVKTVIKTNEFNDMFEQDTEEEQFKDGKFKLADGSVIKADYFSYGSSDLFDYATAIFFEGELANLQLETSKSEDEIQESLGIKFGEGNTMNKTRIGYEINFNETFGDDNINTFPFEW